MISIKGGTKTWSDAEQLSSLKADKTQNHAPSEYSSAFGDQSLGDVLNKVADPNWVDPKKMRQVGGSELDKDAFLKLMLTQLKHQDPTNPLKSHEMAAQLAQFTSLEQLNNINSTLEKMSETSKPDERHNFLTYIGKSIRGDTSIFARNKQDKSHELHFRLPQKAEKVEIVIKSPEGKEVKKFTMHNVAEGANKIDWNGVTEEGMQARAGQYRFEVNAVAANGRKLAAQTDFEGTVTGVKLHEGHPVLMMGNQAIRLADVTQIGLSTAEAPTVNGKAQDITPKDQVKAAKGEEPDVSPEQAGNLDEVGMSQGLLNKIEKEVGTGS